MVLLTIDRSVLPRDVREYHLHQFQVPPDAQELRIRFSYEPARTEMAKNLLTITLLSPSGFRGAGHRHAPAQEIIIGPLAATPGFLAGPLPAGTWTLEVDVHAVLTQPDGTGCRYHAEVSALTRRNTANEEGAPPPTIRHPPTAVLRPPLTPINPGSSVHGRSASGPRPQPSMGRWLKGELHVHSDHSDGRWTAEDLAQHAVATGLDFLALTDHNTVSGVPVLLEYVQAQGLSLLVIPALELTTHWGHANALGVPAWIDWRTGPPSEGCPAGSPGPAGRTLFDAAAEVHALGGLLVVNHPRSAGYPVCTGCRWEFGDELVRIADAVEVWNGPWGPRPQNVRAIALWDEWATRGIMPSAVAGTDGHGYPARPEEQPYTYVWANFAVDSILESIRANRSYISSGPHLSLEFSRTAEPPRDIRAEEAALLHARIERVTKPVDLVTVRNGEVESRQRVSSPGLYALERLDLKPGDRCRLELYEPSSPLLLALTNHVSIVESSSNTTVGQR